MRAFSEVFERIWNHLKLKPLVALVDWSLRLTDTHHHDFNSRPRPFSHPSHHPAHTHTAPTSSPFRFMIIRSPCFLPVSQLSRPVFTIVPHLTFSVPVSIFACPSFRSWSPLAYQATIDDTASPSRRFSQIHPNSR